MKKSIVIIMAVAMLTFAGSAQALVEYTANFDTDLEGWYFDGTSAWVDSGGQSGGYATNTRNGAIFGWVCPTPGSIVNSFDSPGTDWNANFTVDSETRITFEYYLLPNATVANMDVQLYSTSTAVWRLAFPDYGDADVGTWQKISYTLDTDWTDEEAIAEGWFRTGEGDTSFADTVRDVRWMSVINGNSASVIGVDTFSARTWSPPVTPDDIPGDANLDGVVNDADASTMASNWLQSGKVWADGDFNSDGIVDDLDATILATNWQVPAAGSAVPEPSMIGLLLAALTSLLVVRSKRR